MKNWKTLYQFTVKASDYKSVVMERGIKTPVVMVQDDADGNPLVAAELLRDLAKWAIERAEILEEMEVS